MNNGYGYYMSLDEMINDAVAKGLISFEKKSVVKKAKDFSLWIIKKYRFHIKIKRID